MKRTGTITTMAAVLSGSLVLNTAADPTISDVVVRQRWPWSRLVDIDYTLNCNDPSAKTFIVLSACNGPETNRLDLPLASFSGDLYGVEEGFRHIVWDPTKTSYTNEPIMNFRVSLVSTNLPLYAVVDLTKNAGAAGQIEYLYPGDARLETHDQWTNVWFGVTNDTAYKTDKLVFRRVPAGAFKKGDSAVLTQVAADFYAGVFPITEAQWYRVMGTGSSTSTKPAYEKSYDAIRGSTNNVPSIVWPATGALVSPTNFLGILRDKTAIDSFDLPTDTQREYFCRAGTETVFNDGSPLAKYTGTEEANNGNTNMYLNALGWYKFNCSTLHPVGEKLANAWGIFDTHGNIYEWCLDYSAWKPGEYRILRGGCYLSIAENCRSAYNAGNAPSTLSGIYGFRLVMTLTTN